MRFDYDVLMALLPHRFDPVMGMESIIPDSIYVPDFIQEQLQQRVEPSASTPDTAAIPQNGDTAADQVAGTKRKAAVMDLCSG